MQSFKVMSLGEAFKSLEELSMVFGPEFPYSSQIKGRFDGQSMQPGLKTEMEDRLISGGGSAGGGSINLFPSSESSGCRPICVGVATRSFGLDRNLRVPVTGFKGLMKDLTCYWLRCCSENHRTRIFTFDWNNERFNKEHAEIIEARRSRGAVVEVYFINENQGTVTRMF